MNLNQARAGYPAAWDSIQEQIAEVRATGLDVVPLDARVTDVRGVETLELFTVADCGSPDSDAPAGGIRFHAPIAPRPALQLVT